MIELMTWFMDNEAELLAALGTLLGAAYMVANVYVRLTPSQEDDRALHRFANRIAFLAPKNGRGAFSVPGRRPVLQSDPAPDAENLRNER